MVDDMKRQMCRFEHLIGFKGKLDVVSRESMKSLINALESKYKSDVQQSLRLHRLEFFYDLVKRGDETDRRIEDEAPRIEAKDADDWKDLMTLSRIYYVMEHPRSEGLRWKRRIIAKKQDKFEATDLIEWQVSQKFRLRGLEEWAQSLSDARSLSELSGAENERDTNDKSEEMDELLQLFDPCEKTYSGKMASSRSISGGRRPFRFQDEGMEDWTESYSDDSEYSETEDLVGEMDDFPDAMEREVAELEGARRPSPVEKEMDTPPSDEQLLAEYSPYRDSIFEKMDRAETIEEWFELYNKACALAESEAKPLVHSEVQDKTVSESEKREGKDLPSMDTITEDEEPSEGLDEVEPGLDSVAKSREQAEETVPETEPRTDWETEKGEESEDELSKVEPRTDSVTEIQEKSEVSKVESRTDSVTEIEERSEEPSKDELHTESATENEEQSEKELPKIGQDDDFISESKERVEEELPEIIDPYSDLMTKRKEKGEENLTKVEPLTDSATESEEKLGEELSAKKVESDSATGKELMEFSTGTTDSVTENEEQAKELSKTEQSTDTVTKDEGEKAEVETIQELPDATEEIATDVEIAEEQEEANDAEATRQEVDSKKP